MRTVWMLAMVAGMLAGCQSDGGSASLNSGYSGGSNCSSYDYTQTSSGWCIGRTWR